jgi:hypothetical protein
VDRSKLASDLQPGDRVSIFLGGSARVVSARPTERTMVCRGRAEKGPEALGLLIIYELADGPKRGERHSDILHPDDKVKI